MYINVHYRMSKYTDVFVFDMEYSSDIYVDFSLWDTDMMTISQGNDLLKFYFQFSAISK